MKTDKSLLSLLTRLGALTIEIILWNAMPTHPSFDVFSFDHMVSYFECEFGFIRFENGPVLPLTYNGFHFPGFGILVKAPFGYAKSILRYPMTLLVNYARRLLSGEPTPLRNHVPPQETTALWVTTSPELYAYQQ